MVTSSFPYDSYGREDFSYHTQIIMAKTISRTLIIGLGGTGQTVIRDIKKRLFMRYGEIPPLVRFLALDTDANYYQNTPFRYCFEGENRETTRYNLQPAEFLSLSRPSFDLLRNDPSCANLNFEQLATIYGSLGSHVSSRVLGRAHFLYNADSIIQTLTYAVSSLRNIQLSESQISKGYSMAQSGVTVYIIASLAGATGSSAIMDLSRMVRHAGIDPISSDKVFGMFFMPSFFEHCPNTPCKSINTYVALSELDYVLGLNDSFRYPEGCLERANDLNEYGAFRSYVPVRYSNVYLIDQKTKKGNVHSFYEATGYVASFIAASIAADNAALGSCYSNTSHCLHTVEGKRQYYSGLGYCEIRFYRQHLVHFLLNRQIRDLLDKYKSGDSEIDMNRVADRFIADNHLDDLADFIYSLEDRRFTRIHLRETEPGKQADAIIEKNKDLYLNEISHEANKALQEFGLRKAQLMEDLKILLDDCQSRKGFGSFPNLVLHLKNSFENSLSKLKDKNADRPDTQRRIEERMYLIRQEIAYNASGLRILFSGREKQVHAFDDYAESVNELTLLKLDAIRTDEAIKDYEDLISILNSYYQEESVTFQDGRSGIMMTGTFTVIQEAFDKLMWSVNSELSSYSPSKTARNETIFMDAYLKEYFESHPTDAFFMTEQSIDHINEFICKSLSGGEPVNLELTERMRELVLQLLPEDALIKRIASCEISLDELFVHCFGQAHTIEDSRDFERYPQLGIFRQLDCLFDPLWQYEEFRDQESQPINIQFIVGVCDKTNHLFDVSNGYRDFLPYGSYQFIELGDPDRIVFLLHETAIPAFKMSDARIWENEYQQKKHAIYAFSDKRLEDIDMIMPEKRT